MKRIWAFLTSRSILGALALIGFGLSIYTGFYYERRPELAVSVRALSKVFDVYSPVGGLEVSYAGNDLRASKQTLWILEANIKNDGNAVIGRSDYDEEALLGLSVEGAVIAESPSIESSAHYLRQNVRVISEPNRLLFSPVILEAGDSYDVKVLLLGPESKRPIVAPIGKVAGVKTIRLLTPDSRTAEKSVWKEALEASSLWVHPARLLVYLAGGALGYVLLMVAILLIALPIDEVKTRLRAQARKKKASKYKLHGELNRESRYLLMLYEEQGETGLSEVSRYVLAHSKRAALIEELGGGDLSEQRLAKVVRALLPWDRRCSGVEERLKEVGLVEGEGINTQVSIDLKAELIDLYSYLGLPWKESEPTDPAPA